MRTFQQLFEDSQHAGYETTLETPRVLGAKDIVFVDINRERKIGDVVLDHNGEEITGSRVVRNTPELFQYSHIDNPTEVHFESVELYRNLWVSVHVPQESIKFIAEL